jgi:hypothetical protein
VIEANGDREETGVSKPREKAGVQQRRLACARRTEKCGKHLAPDEAQQFKPLFLASKK